MAGPYFVDITTGNDGDDGLSEGNAFATLAKAADTVGAASVAEAKVWIKASATYDVQDGTNGANMVLATAGTITIPIVWEGYTSSTGDGGIATLSGTSTWDHCIDTNSLSYQVFKNLRMTLAADNGFEGSTFDWYVFKNCRFDNNGANGVNVDNDCGFMNCSAHNNTSYGITADQRVPVINCTSYTNGGRGIDIQNGCIFGCLVYDNGNVEQIHAVESGTAVINCTVDGDNDGASVGFRYTQTAEAVTVVNNIFYDLNYAVHSTTDHSELDLIGFNLYNSIAQSPPNLNILPPNPSSGAGDGIGDRGDVTSTQGDTDLFTDAGAARNYTLKDTSSDAVAAGVDAKFTVDLF